MAKKIKQGVQQRYRLSRNRHEEGLNTHEFHFPALIIMKKLLLSRVLPAITILALVSIWTNGLANAGERTIVSLRDFETEELKFSGFTLMNDATVNIRALGDGIDNKKMSELGMFAYGWIIDAVSRKPVWVMDLRNTDRVKKGREFEGSVDLPKGSYEVYFTAFAFGGSTWFSNFYINIDRRRSNDYVDGKKKGVFDWFEDWFGDDSQAEWEEKVRAWGIDLLVDDNTRSSIFTAPMERKNVIFKSIGVGEKVKVQTGLQVKNGLTIGVYCLGEQATARHIADGGWLINRSTRERICSLERRYGSPAGGAKKNIKFDGEVRLEPGDYILTYMTDDSHSSPDWNAAPPFDPLNYGVTIYLTNPEDAGNIKLTDGDEKEPSLISLVGLGASDTKSSTFTLKEASSLRIYALGEREYSRRQMADFGWIINTRTREKVWTMDAQHTQPAGGDEKNRVADEIVSLPAGTYTVFFKSDDSHSYEDWNSDPPMDEDHWGITIYGADKNFDSKNFVSGGDDREAGILAQINLVGDSQKRHATFDIKKATEVRIYALGEGQNHEMYDYGWIENSSGNIVWEMTYTMTFHAGGGKKNRMVDTKMMFSPGRYTVHYRTDDSHAFNDWNTKPPEDPTMWGITLFEDR